MYIKHLVSVLFLIVSLSVNTVYAASADTPSIRTKKIPDEVIEASKQFGLFKDLYTSPKKIVTYSYAPGSTCPYQSQEFHNKVSAAAARLGYSARPILPARLKKDMNAINARAKNKAYKENVKSLKTLFRFTNQCTLRACIINPAKGEYILMNHNADEVLRTMSQYK